MRVEVWNCRDLGQCLTVRRLKEIHRVYLPDMLFLVETKKVDDYVRDIGSQLGYDQMKIVSPQGLSGEFLDLAQSDHRPLIVSIEYEGRVKRGQFRYDKRLAQDEDFVQTVVNFWTNRNQVHLEFSSKLKRCRREMAKWKRRHRVNAAEDIQMIHSQLDMALRDPHRASWEIKKL
ncbi:unnamed protein product [Microthlaspi erraticum]|uniref:Endonuclease/exonuclease/phosphatase domain-containing protein n=1 Tax=Microthlaspi erraticum TaxID=1685480 RepID=A0A6D2HTF9_9BRAS|nr:unnamed protein product [Microthlaspi erraticum]